MPVPTKKYIKVFFTLTFLLLPLFTNQLNLQAAVRQPTNLDNLKTKLQDPSPEYVPNEVIVKFKKNQLDIASNSLMTTVKKFSFPLFKGLKSKSENHLGNSVVYKINKRVSVTQAISALRQDDSVEYAEPNYYRHLASLGTDDTYATNLWGLDNTGQTLTLSDGTTTTGITDADIDMPEAWAVSTGTTQVIVAVIDTGVAYNHPDLINNMWDGTNCVDENGDPLGSCLHGYDFEDDDTNPLPATEDHGTHIAGTIAATRNNSTGVAGVGPQIKIMAIKCDLTISCLVSSINFALENGAKVINASYAGPSTSSPEYDAISAFQAAGGIFVAAAGNEDTDNDITHSYPSDYDLSGIISVAAIDQGNSLASFSNYGGTSVDVAAPGVNIYSTTDKALIIDYNFDSLSGGSLPSTWTSDLGSSWVSLGTTDKAVWTDLATPYAEGVNSVVTADTIDLSSISNAKFEFTTGCDTELTDPDSGGDYMALEVSSDGTNFTQLTRWNEFTLAIDGVSSPGINGYADILDIGVSANYLTSNFKYRLRWVTDTDGSYGTGNGCYIDDFKIINYTDGSDELYSFKDGTSMATPHVVGLAGYLWSASPTSTANEIISNILTNGDSLSSLSSTTVTGKKINAYNSIMALGITAPGPSITGLTNDSTPTRSKTWNWSSDNPDTDTYRYLINQSVSSTISTSYGSGTTASVSVGTGTYYIHVQAKDVSENEGDVTTVSAILDNTGPIVTLSSGTTNSFVLGFGETLYDVGGTAFVNDQDMATFFTATPVSVSLIGATYTDNTINLTVSGPIAGSRVTLNNGTSATNLYDSLGNGSTDITTTFNGLDWQVNPTFLNIGTSYLPDLFISGVFVTTPGTTSGQSLNINVADTLLINIGDTSTTSKVSIASNTDISQLSDAEFDASQIDLTNVDTGTISNLGSDYTAEGAIQWGIVGTTLKFNNPLTINIYVGAEFNDQTLTVLRSSDLSFGWTGDGIVSPATCTVSSGFCQFTATQASYYVAAYSASITPTPTTTLTPTSAPSNNSAPHTFTVVHSPPRCTDKSPLQTPDLFAIKTKVVSKKGSAQLFFTPVSDKITGYAVIYGFKKDDDRFGAIFDSINNNEGEQNFTVNNLDPQTTYYFKVTALNGCTSGPWSTWLPAKANRTASVYKYKKLFSGKIFKLVENIFK